MKKVVVLGLGYVGLPLAVAIKETGKYDVVGFDISDRVLKTINSGRPPFTDPELQERMKETKVLATKDESKIKNADFYIVCVPTPVTDLFEPDLGPVKSASATIARNMKAGAKVIVESTINPGVCEEEVIPVIEEVSGLKAGKDFDLAHCPERINPGDSRWSVYNIPRNIGATTKSGAEKIAKFYRTFIKAQVNVVSSLKVAESTKIIENTFRDINIAYVNELAKSFDKMGIDLVETIEAASNKPFAFMAHYPGAGVGGHCIPVDPYYLIKRAKQSGFDHQFLKYAREVNNSMPNYTVDLLQDGLNAISMPVKGTKVMVYGLSYKANVGDLRESPALKILKLLEELGAEIIKYDPYLLDMSNVESLEKGLKSAEALLVATNHNEIKKVDFSKYPKLKAIIDGRNCLDSEKIHQLGIYYKGIGR